MIDENQTADALIPGSLRRSRSYHADYGSKTYGEIRELASTRPPDRKARRMKKLIEQADRPLAGEGQETTQMKAGTTLQRGIKTIGRLWEAGQFDEALALVDRLLALSPGHPGLLIYRAQLIQLQDREDGPTLEEARSDLELAAKLDPESPAALTELGYLSYAVFDDSATADRHFVKAIARSKAMLREALIGRAKALHELGRDREAFACLAEARDLPASGPLNGVDLLDTFRTLIASDSELDD